MTDSTDKALLKLGHREVEFPVLHGTLGPDVINVKQLANLDIYTYDPGYYSTASCSSSITYIDGGKGILLHRGYPIEQLVEQCDYMDVCYLLLNGDLPSAQHKAEFVKKINHHRLIHEQISRFFSGFRRDAHPMAVMVGVVGALSAFYHYDVDSSNAEEMQMAAIRLVAKVPTLAAMCYKYSIGQPFIYPHKSMDFSSNYLHMMFSAPHEDYTINPILARAMDRILILHADHEQNASTSTVRVAGSTGANPFACISAGIGCLWGPAHGGANEACLNMLKEIGDEKHIGQYIKKAQDPNDPFRLMGFGHRVYKNYDPRAKVMRETCHEVLKTVGATDDPLFKLAMKLEKIALEDEYFIERKLYPNVDFYSGITLSALGIPTNMFTVIFAIGRTVGWMANWIEMISDPERRLARPRQLYVGSGRRDVMPIEKR